VAEITGERGIPSPTIRVIGAGFGRTGTLSLREALVRLGFGPCDHMLENFDHPTRFALWRDAFRRKQRGERIDWRPLLEGYRAVVDWPGVYFWRELTEAHPDARVILTVRDPDRWYDSAQATIFAMRARAEESPWSRAALRAIAPLIPRLRQGMQLADEVIWEGTFGGRFPDRSHALAVFGEHNEAVQATIPAERLLVFDVKQGWGPLCAFLGVPVPEHESFPHANDAETFRRRFQERLAAAALRTVGSALVVAIGIAALVLAAKRRSRDREES
jgi:hypothetical protein